ncbi:MAG: 16S rRNA (uracil(1498)-N(3))-methyltransferase [Micrococcaceae bacterium]
MTAHLFYLVHDAPFDIDQTVSITGDEFKHAMVRRIEVGEEILLADGKGQKFLANVQEKLADSLVCFLKKKINEKHETDITVVQALAKGGRDEMALEICTEIGARSFIPWQAKRSIVKWNSSKEKKMVQRWQAIALNAAKQSRRSFIPSIEKLKDSKALLPLLKNQQIYVLHEDASTGFKDVTIDFKKPITLIVGPEGGITEEELQLFKRSGATTVNVSQNILRSSTAAAVALTQLLYSQNL